MLSCPVCAGPAGAEIAHAGVLDVRCSRCGLFAVSAAAQQLLATRSLDHGDRLWLSERVRADHDAARVSVVVFTSRLLTWLDERATLRPPDGAASEARDPGVVRGQRLRQR